MMGLLSDTEVGLAAPTAAPGPKLSTRDAMTKVALEAPLTPLDPFEAESQHPQYGPDIADLKSEIVKNKNNPKKLSMLQEHLDNVQPKAKSGLLSDFDVGLTKLDPNGPVTNKEHKIEQVKSLLGNKAKFEGGPSAKDAGKDLLGSTAAFADMFEGLFTMAASWGGYAAAKTVGTQMGQGNQEAATSAKKISEDGLIPDAMVAPFHQVMKSLGHEDAYNESTVAKAMNFIGKGIEKGTGWMAQQTGNLVPQEDWQFLSNGLMLVFGTKGGDAVFKKAMLEKINKNTSAPTNTFDLERIEAEKFAAQQAGTSPTVAKAAMAGSVGDKATSDAHAWLTPVELPEKSKTRESKILDSEGKPFMVDKGLSQIGTTDTPALPSRGDKAAMQDYASKNKLSLTEAYKDVTLKKATLALGAVGAVGYLALNPDDAKNLGPGLLAVGAVMGADRSGVWTKGAVKRLAEPLSDAAARGVGNAEAARAPAGTQLDVMAKAQIPVVQWADRAITKHLNKHFGAETDPLNSVKIPMLGDDVTWGEVADKVVKSAKIPVRLDMMKKGEAMPGEAVWDIEKDKWVDDRRNTQQAEHFNALTSYLSHVGDYLREFVSAEKLQQYDLTRAVKETAAQDVRQAAKMEKAQIAAMEGMSVYKAYPDGMKWVEVGKVEPETVEQLSAKGFRIQQEDAVGGTHFRVVTAKGTPISIFTGKPEAAWKELAGERAKDAANAALKNEGDIMGHCVGGYCEAVHSGESKIYSLRDAKGMSHVTVEVAPEMTQGRVETAWDAKANIVQIKGKQNRAPVAQYLPYVQDFVKSGKWGDVGDLQNSGLVKVSNKFLTSDEIRSANWTAEQTRPHPSGSGGAMYNVKDEAGNTLSEVGHHLANNPEAAIRKYKNVLTGAHDLADYADRPAAPNGVPRGPVDVGLGIDAVKWAKDNPKKAMALAGGLAVATVTEATNPNNPVGKALGLTALGAAAGFGLSHFPALWESVRSPGKNIPYSQAMADSLYKLTKQSQANQIGMLKIVKEVPKTYAANAELIYHSLEDSKIQLSPEAQALKAKYVDPLMKQNEIIREALKNEGINVGQDVDSYVHRISKGHPSIFEELERQLPGQGRTLSQFATALKERKVFALEEPNFGTKVYMVMDPKGTGYKAYQNGKVVGQGKATPAELAAGDIKLGQGLWKKGPATTVEIEANTPIQYHHDAMASAIGSNVRLTQVYNNVKYLKDLIKDPAFKKVATQDLGNAPADWREVPDIPQLKGYKFDPRVANVLEDFSGKGGSLLSQNIGKISRVLTGSLFWNPLPHILNILDHNVVQRGLMSGWANPAAYPRLMRTSIQAWKAVTEQNSDYSRFVKEGAGLMYPNVLVADFSAKVLKQLGTDPKMGPVAAAWGYANPVALGQAIYRNARQSLWKWNDVIMMQAYLEKESIKGGAASVIKDVERHIPNYRIPDQVLGSRQISEFLRSPVALAFGRYDYGRMKSYGEMVKGLVAKDSTITDRAHALDQMAMVGFMGLVVYPLVMDNVAKALTGNNNATVQRFGASTIPYLAYEYLYKDKNLVEVANSMFPSGMALNAAFSLRNNRDMFSGKHLIEEPADVAAFAARQLSPLYAGERIIEGKTTKGQFALQAVGIKSPTVEQVEKKEAYKERERKYQERRKEKQQ